MTLAQFMQWCLTAPNEGFYTASHHVFGERGHFVTSPDISQMFGEVCRGVARR
jgi:NADH dehydrogenase [ubiquinone] 1 alpha subcomplex assembly factor 7